MEKLDEYRRQLQGKRPKEILRWALDEFGPDKITLASSFSIEDQVLTHIMAGIDRDSRVFTLDTGRLFQETYNVMQSTVEKYGIRYEVCFPDAGDVADMVAEKGPNLFYDSLENRKKCCDVRKMASLRKVLGTTDAWVCGLRQEQSVTRTDVEAIEWDSVFGLYKLNPLYNWTEDDVWDFIRDHGIPYNALYKAGFRSIGCAPCTRAIGADDDVRAGRWWWESPEHKECGLHCASVKQDFSKTTT